MTGPARIRLLFWLLAPLYLLVFAEAFIRVLQPTAIIPRYVTGAPFGVRVGMPNMRFPQTSPEMRVEIRTNSRGIRADRETSYERSGRGCRMVLLGDSFFVGFEVEVEESFPYLIEKRLAEAGYPCEVINLAVAGFGTAEMLVMLQNEALKYRPDIVVFSSHETDLNDNIRSGLFAVNGNGELVRQNATFLPGIAVSDALSRLALYRWVVENSQLYSAIRERLAFIVKRLLVSLKMDDLPDAEAPADQAAAGESGSYPERLNLLLLREAKRVSESGGARFCVLEIPMDVSRTRFERKLPEYDPSVIGELHIFSPLATFLAAADPGRKIYYEKAHRHLSPFGNRLLAEFFVERIKSTGWLRRESRQSENGAEGSK